MFNNSSAGTVHVEEIQTEILTIYRVMSILLWLGGTPLNVIPVVAMIRSKLHKMDMNLLLINLALTNAFMSGVLAPCTFTVTYLIHTSVDSHVYVIQVYLLYVTVGTELNGILIISFNRYVSIVHFQKYGAIFNRKRNLAILIVNGWLLNLAVFSYPVIQIWNKGRTEHVRFMFLPMYYTNTTVKYVNLIWLWGTSLILVALYVRIFHKVHTTRRKVMSVPATTTHARRSERHLLLTVVLVVSCFYVLYIPLTVLAIWDPQMTLTRPSVHVTLCTTSALYCIIDPIIYIFSNKPIQTALKSLLWSKK